MVKRKIIAIVVLLVVAGGVQGATEAQKRAAIDAGLEYLASAQQSDGRWEYGDTGSDVGATGAAVLAFLEEDYVAGTDVVFGGTNYGDVVGDGINYLLGQARPYTISNEPAGNPDNDPMSNGIGVKFNYTSANNNRDIYASGLAVPAIASSGTPNKLVTVGPLAGRTDGTGSGGQWTYKDVVQNATDYFAYAQADPTGSYNSGAWGEWARGGWRYYADYGQADNSTAQWPPIAMMYSTKMGVSAPQWVKDETAYWIDYIQDLGTKPWGGASPAAYHGSSWYAPTHSTIYPSESKTGGLLLEMVFAGSDLSSVPYDLGHPDLQAALAYLDREWRDTPSGTWYGNIGHPYAMWAVYKGLETTVGLNDTTYITNYYYNPATVTLDDGDVYTWWEDYCEWLVKNQNQTTGAWGGYSSWYGPLAAAWNINILAATEIPGEVIPAPGAILLGGIGVGLVGWMRRRRML